MDLLLSRFRNLLVLVIAIGAQLLLLGWQVQSKNDVRLVRVWAVTAVTPLARVIEGIRSSTTGFFTDYFYLLDVRDENRRMKAELGRIKLENQFLKSELSTADRARALQQFQSRSPSRTIAARIIGNGTGSNSRVVYIDRGTTTGVLKGMAVITPDGIVGKVISAFPVASQVLLITDPTFAAGVISQKNHARGTLKGEGKPNCFIDYVQNEQNVEVGEWFFTTGDDRVFPKGLPVGQVTIVRNGRSVKEIYVTPSGFQNGFEEVLVVIEGVHQALPDAQTPSSTETRMLPPPPAEERTGDAATPTTGAQTIGTDADRMLERYKKIGEATNHPYGTYGSPTPNFNIDPNDPKYRKNPAPAGAPPNPQQPATQPPAGVPKPTTPAAPATPNRTLP